ncbi:MAG: hypothetical protein HZB15_06145 [Actinobacteria bacterium]|nr:hypothetical protein [Actinomycetota bacterium]
MTITRGRLAIVAGALLLYFALLMTVWAARPLESDSVPVGVDWTPTTAVPAQPERNAVQVVECNSLFDGDAFDEPLPALTPQPAGRPALAYQHEPCALIHRDARIVFAINALGLLAGLVVLGWLAVRAGRARRVELAQAPQRL